MTKIHEVKRGDILKVGRTKWLIFRVIGSMQAWVYKHPSARKKQYELRIRAHGSDEVEVFEMGGSGQQIGPVLVTGEVELIGHLTEDEMYK